MKMVDTKNDSFITWKEDSLCRLIIYLYRGLSSSTREVNT